MDISAIKEKNKKQLSADASELEKRAELGFELPKTREYILKRLVEIGYDPRIIGKGSILAELNQGKGQALLLRADMDALPFDEGARHVCGHHFHTASLLCAAEIIYERKAELKSNIKLLFQASEETLEGAKDCIEAGILENPRVKRAYMLHVLTALPLPVGCVIVSSEGVSAPAAAFFEIEIKGSSSHGASPEGSVDALTAGANLALALEHLPAKELFGSGALLTVGKFTSGRAPNVIADTALLEGTVRATEERILEKALKRTEEMTENIGKAYCAKSEFRIKSGCPPLINDKEASETAYTLLGKIKGIKPIYSKELERSGKPMQRGSEDFSFIAKEVPSCMIGVAAGEWDKGYTKPLHHPDVAFDENALSVAAAIYASLALE